MPSHLYVTKKPKATLWDIIKGHAVELAVVSYSLITGIAVVTVLVRAAGAVPSATLQAVPGYFLYGIGGFLTLGGVLALGGLLIRRHNVRRELNIEQSGWILLGVAWGIYLYSAVRYMDGAVLQASFALFIGLGCAGRVAALVGIERQLEAAVEAVTAPQEGTPDATA